MNYEDDDYVNAEDMRIEYISNFDDVGEFHKRYKVPHVSQSDPHIADNETMNFRVEFIEEELNELKTAIENKDIEKIADGLVDICYVAMGTAHIMGLPWQKIWNEIHKTNMNKILVEETSPLIKKENKRFTVVKPEGWKEPNLKRILEE